MCCDERDEIVEPLRIIGWMAYYPDRTYTSRETPFADLPADGCQGVMAYESKLAPGGGHTRQWLGGYDCYLEATDPEHGLYYAGNNDSVAENERRYPGAAIKRGQWVHPQRAAEIQAKAFADQWR